MFKSIYCLSFCWVIVTIGFASSPAVEQDAVTNTQSPEQWVTIDSDGFPLAGMLLAGANNNTDSPKTAVLILAGSGPTDHNGNNEQAGLITNSYQMLATALHTAGLTVLRVDKRGIGKSVHASFDMASTDFQTYVDDAVNWINYLKDKHKNVVVIGHSLGGLVGMQAAQKTDIDQLIMLASVADSTFNTIKRQLSEQPAFVSEAANPLLDRLAKDETIAVEDIPPYLHALLHPKIQLYLKSFMQLEPRTELMKISTPTLVVIGDTDIQVTVKETQQMVAALDHVKFKVIEGMNHVLKPAPAERLANMATYSNPDLPLHDALMPMILAFIDK